MFKIKTYILNLLMAAWVYGDYYIQQCGQSQQTHPSSRLLERTSLTGDKTFLTPTQNLFIETNVWTPKEKIKFTWKLQQWVQKDYKIKTSKLMKNATRP